MRTKTGGGRGTISSAIKRLSNPSGGRRGTTGSAIKTGAMGATGGSAGATGVRREGWKKGVEEADSGESATRGGISTAGGGDRERLTDKRMGSGGQRGARGESGNVVATEFAECDGDGESGART